MLPALLLLLAPPAPALGCSPIIPPPPVLLPFVEPGEVGVLPANGALLVPFDSTLWGTLWRADDDDPYAQPLDVRRELTDGLPLLSQARPAQGFEPGGLYRFADNARPSQWTEEEVEFLVADEEDHRPPELELISWEGSHWVDDLTGCGGGSSFGVTYRFAASDEPRIIVRLDGEDSELELGFKFGGDSLFFYGTPDPAEPHRFVAVDLAGNLSDEVVAPPTIACGACSGSVGGPPGGVLLLLLLLRRQSSSNFPRTQLPGSPDGPTPTS